jgi:DNA-binding MarR family transcriptional regulator
MSDKQLAGLSDLIGYQLHLTHLLALRDARAALEEKETTPAKVTALAFVRDNPGCDQSTLARFLDVNRSSAMKLVNVLEDQRLIERQEGRDRRSNGLRLTRQGQDSLKEMISILAAAEARLVQGLSLPERRELLRLLAKMRAGQLGEAADETTGSPQRRRAAG